MNDDRFARAREVFVGAAALEPGLRPTFLDEACAGDAALRDEVEDLLRFHRAEEDLIQDVPIRVRAAPPEVPKTIGRYRLLDQLGEGGMGEVYEAEQLEPVRRRVALKLIRWGLASGEVLARFDAERQALALMNHPSIARVYDAGATEDGRPYFVMELVDGVPVTEYCDRHRLTTRERLDLFVEICRGVEHAHQKGVIHRDLKPSNVLVTREGDRAQPKIIDFGVAKATSQRLTERTVFTELGQWVGTPEYMSPEQAGGLDVDTRSDVYSLGVVLYELLSGTAPFDPATLRAEGFDEMRRRIREDEPPRPSTRVKTPGGAAQTAAGQRRTDVSALIKALRGDLDWVVMRALEKDRARRYSSPAELAADVRRHLELMPVEAGPPSAAYRLRKLARRHRVGVTAAVLVTFALLGGLTAATLGLVRARRAERLANTQVELLIGMLEAMDPGGESGGTRSVAGILAEAEERIDRELIDQPMVRARLLATLGSIYFNLGDHQRALPVLEEVVEVRRRKLGAVDEEVAVALRSLGALQGLMNDLDVALPTLRQALAIDEEIHGPDHPVTAESLNALAFELWRNGEHEEAGELFDRALAIREREFGPNHVVVGDTLYMQGILLRDRGEFDRARAGFERALSIRERVFGSEHTAVAWVLNAYGVLLLRLGELNLARDALERARTIQEKTFGGEHFSVFAPILWLGEVEVAAGNSKMAQQRFEQVLAFQEHQYGPDDRILVGTLDRLARLAYRTGNLERSRDLFERRLEILERTADPGHLSIHRAALDVAALRIRTGDPAGARELYAPAKRPVVESLVSATDDVDVHFYNLACLAALIGERDDAVRWLEHAVDQGFVDPMIADDPDLDSVRSDPRFQRILVRVQERVRSSTSRRPP